MSSNVARHAPVKSETKRSKRLLASTRKIRQQRENIENTLSASLSSVTLANLPLQKQSTQIRKRLLTECQSNAALTPGDQLSNKRQKLLLDDPRSDSAAFASSVPPLHRTLSDKSSYLNQAPLHELSPDAKSHSTLALWKRPPQLCRTTSDSDADADDEDDPLQRTASPASKLQALPQSPAMSAKRDPHTLSTLKDNHQPIREVSKASKQSSSLPSHQHLLSMDDDELFGSDTTLTSPEDDSDDDITGHSHLTTKVKHTRSTKREVPFSIRTRSKKAASLTVTSQSSIESNTSDPSTNDASSLPQIQSPVEQPAPELVVGPVISVAPMSLMVRILEGRKRPTEAELNEDEADSSDDAQSEMTAVVAPLPLKTEFPLAPVPLDDVSLNATVVESLLKDIYTAVCSPGGDLPSSTCTTAPAAATEGNVFAIPTLPVLRRNRSYSSSRAKPSRSADLNDRSSTRQYASRQPSRTMPHPRLFQTCRDIMSQSDPDRHLADIQSISLVLKHSLEQGMRKIQDAAAEVQAKSDMNAKPKVGSVNMQAWGAVIGNGKGLFRESPRRQREIERIAERRNLVEETYRALDFSPPPPGWDKSSQVILEKLTPEKSPAKTRSGKAEKRWPSELDNTLGCDYCRKTYMDQAGLAYHMERCTMAQMQTSIATDMDGDSTASETEDQRMARSPTALLEKKAGLKIMEEISENDDEEEEDEEGDEEGIIMCVCGSKEDEGAMVQCDKCEVWLHLECLNLSEDDVPEEYFCPTCQGLPTPSTGGKSFRHIPVRASERSRSQTKAGRPRRQLESQGAVLAKGSRRVARSKPVPHWMHVRQDTKIETGSDTEDTYSTGSDEDESQHSRESVGSPQVTLNHDWRSVGQGSGSILGYDSEYMNTLFGGASAHTVFKKSKAPALMLGGSSSQKVQEELTNNLLSTDLGLNDHEEIVFPGASNRHTIMGANFDSDPLFDQGYLGIDSSQNLGSDDTIDSDGLRTPIDLWRDTDQGDQWVSNNIGEVISEKAAEFALENSASVSSEYKSTAAVVGLEHYPELLTNNVIDWYCDQDLHRADNFDIDGEDCYLS
ncbi:myeloid lymphoid or mixed-lineage leukemia 5 (trithorax, ) [Linnemannia schmuckeri]|uniref:Myeloid lymphoid or mixed-lineage leukemia 5 (Trithorax, ) n=1 Tax=Linnemannia schmuckeri TaxID=64567 RepID=A0A9P5S9X7_9FUNG|nr:myeloid lymphoid or mixed-lineage leukemia 5 (trithorax, ) [Linnemannia schmuckeri]